MEKALEVARQNLAEILTVGEWAEKMSYSSPKYFSRKFRNHFGIRPKYKLIELRVNRFFEIIKNDPSLSCYEIAFQLGLRDEIALNKFIKRHTGKPPSKWKKGIVNQDSKNRYQNFLQ